MEELRPTGSEEISKLAREITYHRFRMTRNNIQRYFHELELPDYIVMEMANRRAEEPGSDGKLYLQEIAEAMDLPVQQVSQIVQTLESRALVQWAHDGNGSAGTYIILDPAGKELLRRQEEGLKEYYGRVVEKFGKEDFICLLGLLTRLEYVMKEEAHSQEAENEQ